MCKTGRWECMLAHRHCVCYEPSEASTDCWQYLHMCIRGYRFPLYWDRHVVWLLLLLVSNDELREAPTVAACGRPLDPEEHDDQRDGEHRGPHPVPVWWVHHDGCDVCTSMCVCVCFLVCVRNTHLWIRLIQQQQKTTTHTHIWTGQRSCAPGCAGATAADATTTTAPSPRA